ncbi:hypothetical protein ACWJKU_15060 [Methylocaldum sp. MU1018]
MTNVDTDSSIHESPLSNQPGANVSAGPETHPSEFKTEAGQAAGEIGRDMQRLKEEARQRGKSLLKGQRHAAAEQIGGMAEALHRTAQQLNEREQPTTAHYVDRAAEALDRMVDTVREGDLSTWVSRTEDFARRNPGVFFGGSVLAGFMLSRFLKSSAERREAESTHGAGERTGAEPRYTH